MALGKPKERIESRFMVTTNAPKISPLLVDYRDGERQWRRQPMKPTDCIKLSLSIVRMSILTSNGQEIRFPSILTCFAALSVFLVLTTLTLYSSSTAFAIGRPLRGSPPSPGSATSPSSSKPHAAGMRSSARASAGRVQASDEPIIGV